MTCECGCGKIAKAGKRFAHHYIPSPGFGEGHHSWNGGRTTVNGYVLIRVGDDYIREHILVAEKALGHPLPPKAVIHHVDERKTNNAPNNLVICEDQPYHLLLHRRLKALLACGDPSALPCSICRGYERQGEMYVHRRRNSPVPRARHKDCVYREMKPIRDRRRRASQVLSA